MIRKFISILFLFFIISKNFAQEPIPQYTNLNRQAILHVTEKPLSPSETKGTVYLHEEWQNGSVYLNNVQLIEDYPLKYDLERNQMEIKLDRAIKVLPLEKIEKFIWENLGTGKEHVFINADKYVEENVPAFGIFEVIIDGNMKLLAKPELDLIKPSYNVQLDVGDKDRKYVKSAAYYLAKNERLFRVENKNKHNFNLFGEHSNDIKKFVADHKLKFKREEDLTKIVEYYNSL